MGVNQITRITLAWELWENGVPKSHIASQIGIHRETVGIWIDGISRHELGLSGFLGNYLTCKKGEREKRKIDPSIKNKIWNLRDSQRDCCGQKIRKFLIDKHGIELSATTIYKVLSEKYQLRSKWKKNQVRGPVPKAIRPREVIQMDTVDFGEIFAFTGVDIFTREIMVKLYSSLTSFDGSNFLDHSFKNRYTHTKLLQTDGGPEFKAGFKVKALTFADRLRVARPYKKNEQSYIESFNRSLRKECLGWTKYKKNQIIDLQSEVERYILWYHNERPHMSLNMQTPNQYLKSYLVSDI